MYVLTIRDTFLDGWWKGPGARGTSFVWRAGPTISYRSQHEVVGLRSKGRNAYFRKFSPAFKQWAQMKNMLDLLVQHQRIEATLPKAKELQQYAEEL